MIFTEPSIAAQMAFYLEVSKDDIQFLESAFGVDHCTIEANGTWFDVFFDGTGMVTEYLHA